MRRGQKFLIYYFLFFGALSVIAVIPGGALFVLILTGMALPLFGMPGFLVIVSPTILLYSVSLVPLWLALTAPHRRPWRTAIAVLIPVAVAVGPGLVARFQVWSFAQRTNRDDFTNVALGHPKTIEIIADELTEFFANGVGDTRVPCGDACRRVLFNQEVEQVRLTKAPAVFRGSRPSAPRFSVSYHIEHRPSCPDLYSPNAAVDKAIRDRLAAGECLIFDTGDNERREATLDFTTLNHWQLNPVGGDMQAPTGAIIERVLRLQIAQQQAGAAAVRVQQRTEIKALAASIPFYIGFEMHMQGGYNGPILGRDVVIENPADLTTVLRQTFGFAVADIAPLSGADAVKLADQIFSLPHDNYPTLSREQQGLLADIVAGMAKKPDLAAADFNFVLRLLNEPRIGEATIGFNIQKVVQRYPSNFTTAIPVMLDRIETPALQSDGRYQTSLSWTLMAYPADILRPYRDQIVRIVEKEKSGPAGPLLARISELGEPPVDLIAERLKSKAPEVRGFAALAICRADSEAWPALEPLALAHLADGTMDSRLQDDHRKLILALVRFGNKAVAAEALARLLSRGQEDAQKRLATFEPGFGADRCRDFL